MEVGERHCCKAAVECLVPGTLPAEFVVCIEVAPVLVGAAAAVGPRPRSRTV